jgi:hypothetical protein
MDILCPLGDRLFDGHFLTGGSKILSGHFLSETLLILILILKIGLARSVPKKFSITQNISLARSVPILFVITQNDSIARSVPNLFVITQIKALRAPDKKCPDRTCPALLTRGSRQVIL